MHDRDESASITSSNQRQWSDLKTIAVVLIVQGTLGALALYLYFCFH